MLRDVLFSKMKFYKKFTFCDGREDLMNLLYCSLTESKSLHPHGTHLNQKLLKPELANAIYINIQQHIPS